MPARVPNKNARILAYCNTVKYKITPPPFGRERNFYDGFTVKN